MRALNLLSSLLLLGATSASVAGPLPHAIAFVDVAIVPMDRDVVLPHQTVLVENGTIAAIGSAGGIVLPPGTQIVSGSGKWLAPGLADMHTHVDDPADFPLFLASGVTTTLNMGGSSDAYRGKIRQAIRSGALPGPDPLAALMIDGTGDPGGSAVVPKDAAEARRIVDGAPQNGFDYMKVYSRLSPGIFDAIMDEAQKIHMPVVGHVVRSVGLKTSLERGQLMIAHAEEYLTVFGDGPPDDSKIPELVALSAAHHVAVTANIFGVGRIAEQWGHPDIVRGYLESPEAAPLRPEIVAKWRTASYAGLDGSYSAEAAFCKKLIAALHQAGVPILIGTDTPDIPGMAPGASALHEITALHEAGFSNYDALASATRVAGAFVHETLPDADRFGTIAPGYRADLILLPGNPLSSLDVLSTPSGVMVRGAWLSADKLRRMVQAPVPGYDRAEKAISKFQSDVRAKGAAAAIAADRDGLSKPAPLRLPLSAILALERDEASAGHTGNAVALLMFTIDLYPASWRAYARLGDIDEKRGDMAGAVAAWKKSLELNPKYDDLIAKINGAAKAH